MNDQSEMLLNMLHLYAEHNLEGITTGGESWLLYTIYGDSMFATSAREVMPTTRQKISQSTICYFVGDCIALGDEF
jgi:flagellar motor protein MotB